MGLLAAVVSADSWHFGGRTGSGDQFYGSIASGIFA